MRFAKIGFSVVAFLLLSTTAQAAEWYVSTSGNDASAGTLAAPFRTITKAATAARPGDNVNVRGGVYYEVVKISSKGTATARIAFRPYGTELPVIDGTGSATNTSLVQLFEAQYVDFSGFEVRNSTRLGIHGYASHHVSANGNSVHHNYRGGIYFSNPAGGVATDITVRANKVYNNCLENQYHTATSGWGQALGLFRTDGVKVLDNEVYKNHGEGIDFILTDNGVAEGNKVYDNYGVNVYLDNAQYIKVNRNLITTTRDTVYFRHGAPANGISVANEGYEIKNIGTNQVITNNLIVGSRVGFYHGNSVYATGLSNVTVANNTFYGAEWTMVRLDTAAHTNVTFANNIFYQTGGGTMVESTFAGGVTFRTNNWYGGNAGAAGNLTDIIGDPRLVSPGSTRPEDYKLTPASPVLGRGTPQTAVVSDFFNVQRPATVDIGAHQFTGVTTAPVADTQAPAAPASLRSTSVTTNSIALAWNAATDNVGVKQYVLYRGTALIATVTTLAWTDSSLAAATTYSYTVYAVDAAGNRSVASNIASVRTATAATTADTQAPTAATSLRAVTIGTTSVSLAWNASTDNVGVTAYAIHRNKVRVGTATTTVWTDAAVSSRTTYTYQVWTRDAAGNWSPGSNIITVTTK